MKKLSGKSGVKCFSPYKETKFCLSTACPTLSANGSKWGTYWDHSFSAYAKFSGKLTFHTPWYPQVCVHIRGWKMLIFRKLLRTYYMNDPFEKSSCWNGTSITWQQNFSYRAQCPSLFYTKNFLMGMQPVSDTAIINLKQNVFAIISFCMVHSLKIVLITSSSKLWKCSIQEKKTWTKLVEQCKLRKQKILERLEMAKSKSRYTNKLLEQCKSWDGPFINTEELVDIFKSKPDVTK